MSDPSAIQVLNYSPVRGRKIRVWAFWVAAIVPTAIQTTWIALAFWLLPRALDHLWFAILIYGSAIGAGCALLVWSKVRLGLLLPALFFYIPAQAVWLLAFTLVLGMYLTGDAI